ncbi:MAG: hypothetical protein ACYCOR_19135 [Acidobacteriaceae bacterium]
MNSVAAEVLAIGGAALVVYLLVDHFFLSSSGALNPSNPNNVVNSTVSDAVRSATGGTSLSLGDLAYSLLNPSSNNTSNRTTCRKDASGNWVCTNSYFP